MPNSLSPTTSIPPAAMRWPCFSRPRAGGPASDPPRPGSSSSSDTPHDKATDPLRFNEPGLARLFSDAASFGRILTSRSDLVEEGSAAGDNGRDTLQGFSRLVARDLDSSELAVSEKLAQLSVSNWDSGGSTTLAPDVDLGESEDSASDDEHDRALPRGGATQAAGEPDFEDRLTPDEILDLLQQEFGALAPPGEEKLLLETDASLLHDVVILVCLPCEMVQVNSHVYD
jgi:sterol 3beta-glucosyltransferase